MASFEDLFSGGNIVTGIAIAVGTAVLAPVIGPAVSNVLRPAAKAVIKGGIIIYDQGRQAAAQVSEMTSDMVAEARADAQQSEAKASAEAEAQGGTEAQPA
ncbi:MAG TPA: DUF5132 domain-containing protein [Acetobacteraceae bacterium]|nr:DUF5132 domain-containing protein [Acetobacteraceae bacterium]